MPKAFIFPPPDFKGRNERYIAQHLCENIRGAEVVLVGDMVPNLCDPGESFYHTPSWVAHQLRSVQTFATKYLHLVTDEDHLIFTDFWYPGLEMVQMLLEYQRVTPELVGYLHGASFVEGDLQYQTWASPLEEAWLRIYTRIWAASKFFIRHIPRSGKDKVQIVGEPFNPQDCLSCRRTDLNSKRFDIVYPHRLAPDKGFDEFLHLVGCLSTVRPRPTILITAAFPPSQGYLNELAPFIESGMVTISVGAEEDQHLRELALAKVVLSTAIQEGWGYAVLKAISVGCVPVLPNRAVYPELYPRPYLYDSPEEAVQRIQEWCYSYPAGTFVPPATVVGGELNDGLLIR